MRQGYRLKIYDAYRPQKGVNIIRLSNGKAVKALVK